MPFGKNKHLAPRAKKKKVVEAREEAFAATGDDGFVEEEAGEGGEEARDLVWSIKCYLTMA